MVVKVFVIGLPIKILDQAAQMPDKAEAGGAADGDDSRTSEAVRKLYGCDSPNHADYKAQGSELFGFHWSGPPGLGSNRLPIKLIYGNANRCFTPLGEIILRHERPEGTRTRAFLSISVST
ncbi:hypothetical protein BCCH1_79720 (plasmid) [Burkholderia contaminans]|uniref:Uncharacterized protein n=1 Tax=Burkholderia contaminans TaxID=488447 RepID=A0A250LQE0_9BURK|nr:hypothetical protein BCCH1_79720 [Burkholderia contaminans]